ncbi:putative ribonuclease H-like domain-containing protein [Tanacetum coccineum]
MLLSLTDTTVRLYLASGDRLVTLKLLSNACKYFMLPKTIRIVVHGYTATGDLMLSVVLRVISAVYACMVENPNGSNLIQQDLEQNYEDDLKAMDLKWQLSLLSMREKRYHQRTCKKIFINANDTAGYDKSKVECFNCHKMGRFAWECRAPRNKEGQFRKHGNNEDTSSKDCWL